MLKTILAICCLILAVTPVSFAMSCHGGHSEALAEDSHSHESAEALVSAQNVRAESTNQVVSEAINAGNKICPVSGEKIGEEGMEPVTYEYEGKIYNFCCPMCVEEFKKDPQKYIEKVEAEVKEENK